MAFTKSPYIQDTPVIHGKDAKRFMQRMKENRKETPEEMERIKADYEALMEIFEG